jgi:aspartyl-tRNA(Asn)/glutamyl-tRNA(Gln) amidotransferase subunit A
MIAPAEASSNLSRFDGVRYGHRAADYKDLQDMYRKTRAEGFGRSQAPHHGRHLCAVPRLLRRLLPEGAEDPPPDRAGFRAVLNGPDAVCDVIMGPVAPTVAWDLGDKSDDPVAAYLADIYTLSTSLAGLPGMSILAASARRTPVPWACRSSANISAKPSC